MEEEIKQETIQTEQPKKKNNGCLIAFLIIFAILILLIGGVYLGYKQIVKALEPKDLGITYTTKDYEDLMNNLGLEAEASVLCIDCPTPTFSDPHEVNVTVTNEQASAAFEYINQYMSFAQISGTQIKMSDGQAELTTQLTFQGQTFPIYMTGTISKASENSITGEIYDFSAGALKVPSNIKELVTDGLLNIANEKIASAGENIRIDEIDITEKGVTFDGLIPSKAE